MVEPGTDPQVLFMFAAGIPPGMLGYLPPLPPHLMGRVGLMPGKGHASTDYTRYTLEV
jgi:hypothetical protein